VVFVALCLAVGAVPAQNRKADKATVQADDLQKWLSYLASDELEGRRPGTVGADKAADYLAEEFHRLKLGCASNLGGGDLECRHNGKRRDGYLKEFPFITEVVLSRNNSMSFTRDGKNNAVAIDAEWTPIGFSSNSVVAQSGLVFAGHGITAADLKHDDYANLDAKGKIALVFAGSPEGDNPHGQFGRYADARLKAIAAKDRGAVALVVIAADEKFGIMDLVMGAVRGQGVTVLFVEHDMEIVSRYASRVVAFYDGRVIADGSPAQVLDAEEVRRYVIGDEHAAA
jgi:hypothetical protein